MFIVGFICGVVAMLVMCAEWLVYIGEIGR
jgi:hypothetical protein